MKKVVRTPDFPIVRTKQGRLHGYLEDSVYHFYGIRYGRAKRFRMPEPEPAFSGVRDAKSYGYICPLLPEEPLPEDNPMAAPGSSFEMPHVYWPEKEDCLYLNVWTKSIDPSAKRPVMVWLHGGGYCTGSSIEIPAYNGHNLSSFGDVVIVNLNHRLNCIGFLDLSSLSDRYEYSGCLGLADIVLALKWVHENIRAFGGDPDNVTIAGQSGGGGKAAAMLQMPAADGLYQKVIIQSGLLCKRPGLSLAEEKEHWQRLGERTAEVLGLTAENIEEIERVPYETLAKAAMEAGKSLGYPEGMLLLEPSPVENYYIGMASQVGFREETKKIPVLAGTVLGEFSFMHYLGDKTQYTEVEKYNILEQTFQRRTMAVIMSFRRLYPKLDILYALSVDTMFRSQTKTFLKQRAAFAEADCFNYIMTFIIPYLGGVTPWHCGDIPYVFRNVELEPAHCTGYAYAAELTNLISRAWMSFMKHGNPSTRQLRWTPFDAKHPDHMLLAEETRPETRDDEELLELIAASQKATV